MPSKFREKVYWDTCIFFAWVKQEVRKDPAEMDGVHECVNRAMSGDTLIVTGSFTDLELLPGAFTPEQRRLFSLLFQRRCLQKLPDDPTVMSLAEEIRTYYVLNPDGKGVVESMDSMHLAAAIHFRVAALYTFDEGKRGGRNLLAMDGDVAGRKLKICKPPVTQRRIPF